VVTLYDDICNELDNLKSEISNLLWGERKWQKKFV
jgi:hypothetical protein